MHSKMSGKVLKTTTTLLFKQLLALGQYLLTNEAKPTNLTIERFLNLRFYQKSPYDQLFSGRRRRKKCGGVHWRRHWSKWWRKRSHQLPSANALASNHDEKMASRDHVLRPSFSEKTRFREQQQIDNQAGNLSNSSYSKKEKRLAAKFLFMTTTSESTNTIWDAPIFGQG